MATDGFPDRLRKQGNAKDRTMTEREKFLARFKSRRAEGLVDIKFLVNHDAAPSVDAFLVAANQIADAADAGRCVKQNELDRGLEQTDIAAQL